MIKDSTWAWFNTALYTGLFVSFAAALVISVGCDDSAYCAVGELACDEARLVQCAEDSTGGTKWDTVEDCAQHDDDFFDFRYTCCVIDSEIGCYPEGLCDIQALACQQMPVEVERIQSWIDFNCQGVE